jgi:ubiquinone biosynthesis protein
MPVNLARIPQLARNWSRLVEIAGTLAKYGLADWLASLDSGFVRRLIRRTPIHPITETTHEARFRLALTELGTTFVKLGQVISTRRDLVGLKLADELSRLQSDTPADPFTITKTTIEKELGKPLTVLFTTFNETPLASASIGQVHRATLPDGRDVVVKVQHPDIGPKIQTDLSILSVLADLAEKYLADMRAYKPTAVVAEFGKVLVRELDFRRELRHLQIFTRHFEKDPTVKFPAPVPELSSAHVLTMEYLDGTPLSRSNDLQLAGCDSSKLARSGARVFLDMIFRDGFFHADPHPGNILVLPNGVLGLLDGGMVGRVDETLRGQIERGMVAVMTKDAAALTDLVLQLGHVPPNLDTAGLQTEIADQMAFYWGMPLDQFQLGAALDELTEAVRRYHIVLPPTVSLLLKVLVILEGTGRVLDPHFNLTTVLEEYRSQFVRRRISPKRLFMRMMSSLRDWDDVFQNLPKLARDLMRFAREQRFAVQLQHQHLEPSVNRLVFGLLVSSLFVGSAMLWAFKAPPEIGGVSLFGAFGSFTSILLAYRLFRAIQHSGKLED